MSSGPCHRCGRPGEERVARGGSTVFQCPSCDARPLGFTLHFGYAVFVPACVAAALTLLWAVSR